MYPPVNMGVVTAPPQLQTFAGPVKRFERSTLDQPKRPVREMLG
jgi:hypothetical protein